MGPRGALQHLDDFEEALLNGRRCHEGKVEFDGQRFQLRTPFLGHNELRWERVGRSFFEHAARHIGSLGVVEFSERVDQQNIQNPVPVPSPRGQC